MISGSCNFLIIIRVFPQMLFLNLLDVFQYRLGCFVILKDFPAIRKDVHHQMKESESLCQLWLQSTLASKEQLALQEIVPENMSHCAAESQNALNRAAQKYKILPKITFICLLRYLSCFSVLISVLVGYVTIVWQIKMSVISVKCLVSICFTLWHLI